MFISRTVYMTMAASIKRKRKKEWSSCGYKRRFMKYINNENDLQKHTSCQAWYTTSWNKKKQNKKHNKSNISQNLHTVKPVLRGHLWDKEKVTL